MIWRRGATNVAFYTERLFYASLLTIEMSFNIKIYLILKDASR